MNLQYWIDDFCDFLFKPQPKKLEKKSRYVGSYKNERRKCEIKLNPNTGEIDSVVLYEERVFYQKREF
jgi:hypothetical protein